MLVVDPSAVVRTPFLVSLLIATIGGLLGVSPVVAQPPAGYYDAVDAGSAAALRSTLHEAIDDHTRFPYTSGSTDTWDIVNLADEDPNNISNIIDLYKNASYTKIPGGTGAYNREHTWPSSYGFPNDVTSNYPYTDTHHLFACDASYNSSRSNKPFRFCDASCSEKTTLFNDGRGGGSGLYPGNSNWTTGSFSQGTWETWGGRKGDVARAILYMDIRYEGGVHGVTGHTEPDLIATDNESLIDSSNTGSNETVAYMGMLSDLLQWHLQDPVDSREIWRNEVVYSFQGNRNPFIDHPEWVECLHSNICSDPPPAAPTGLVATGGTGVIDLAWNANSESDLAGYDIYRSTTSGGPYGLLNGSLVANNFYSDTTVSAGVTYYYVVRAVDNGSNESGDSNEDSATASGGGGGGPDEVLLSEVLYDVAGGDDGFEWVELFNAGNNSVDLAGYCLGNGGSNYTTSLVDLSGSIAPGSTYVVGGPTSSSANANPIFDWIWNFSPDFQNSGSTGDGVALFDVGCSQVDSGTVPIDAVVYGPNNNSGLIDETGSASAPEVGDAPAGSSIERTDNAGSWQIQSDPTPNASPLDSGGGGGNPVTITLTSIASDDGWVRESSENSNVGGRYNSTNSGTSALRAGDHRRDRQYSGIVSFDTSSIPSGVQIVSATLRLKRGNVNGTNPFATHGTCWVDVQSGGFSGSTALQNADFEASATAVQSATLSDAPTNGDWSEGSLDTGGLGAINTSGTTQFRFYFDLDDNDDSGHDYIGYYSGNHSNSSNHPVLEVTYQ